jgi:PAS domain S-box-containing protein
MNEVINILCLEDSPRDAEIIRELLTDAGYNLNIDCTAVEKEFVSLLRSHKYDLILSDFKLPGFDGFEALRWSVEICPEVPFICVSGSIGESLAVELLKKGAVDYVLKDKLERLPSAIQRAIDEANEKKARRRAEEALIISETRYRQLFESAKDGILILDAITGQIVDVNPFLIELLGYPREKIIEKTIWEIGFLKDIIANQDKFLELQRKEYVRYEELLLETADGRRIDVEFVSNANLVNHQKVFQCNIRNITERKNIERSLQKERILLRTVIDNIPSTVYVKDTEMRKILVNKADLALIGKPEIEVLGKTDRELFPEEAAVRFSADVMKTGKPLLNREEQVDKYDGQKIWLLTSKLPLHDHEGKITGLVGIGYNITERKRAEEEIYRLNAELEQRVIERTAELSDLYNNAPCGYHLLDSDGLFTRINDTELKWLGYTREEIVGKKRFSDLLTTESAREFAVNFSVSKEQGWVKDLEFDMVRKDGSSLPVVLSATSITDSEGNYLMSRSTIVDNTQRKLAEETMFESQNKLEHLNQELEAFAYTVSHDLRSPLRAIDGFTRILLDEYSTKIDKEGQRLCHVISDNSIKMGQLIDDLLAFSKMNRSAINYSMVDMKVMVSTVFNEITEPEKKAMIRFDMQELPVALCDPGLIKQVWVNLLSNAAKFTRRHAHPDIVVGFKRSDAEITYYVKDNGVGFEQQYANKLFGVFQRLHSSTEFEGTGVGLAIVQRIINRHGGRVWAEGEIQKGATFYFSLPMKKNKKYEQSSEYKEQ